MDLLGIAALGGLERITIVAGAVIIGYWGYRLYTAEKNAGLVFMGLAVVVLVGALATGSSHVKNVVEGYQLASIPTPATQSPGKAPAIAAGATEPGVQSPFAEEVLPASVHPPIAQEATDAPSAQAAVPAQPSATPPAAVAAQAPVAAALPRDYAPETVISPVRLATGQELGGRIVSVKSENVSLEWSPNSD